jgi:hypothetical protein
MDVIGEITANEMEVQPAKPAHQPFNPQSQSRFSEQSALVRRVVDRRLTSLPFRPPSAGKEKQQVTRTKRNETRQNGPPLFAEFSTGAWEHSHSSTIFSPLNLKFTPSLPRGCVSTQCGPPDGGKSQEAKHKNQVIANGKAIVNTL